MAYGDFTLVEKIGLVPLVLRLLGTAVISFITSPFRGRNTPPTVLQHVVYSCFRFALGNTSIRQQQYMNPSTDEAYRVWAGVERTVPRTTMFNDGLKAHWVGELSAKKVLVYLHGGGYALPAGPAHLDLLKDLVKSATAQGHEMSAVLLSYTLAPHATYPTQLAQAVTLLRYLIDDEHKAPGDIILAGDSAGGNLTLAVLSHLLHPHPDAAKVPPLKLSAPLAAAVLISPWVAFSTAYPAWKTNLHSDMLSPAAADTWGAAFLGSAASDVYAEAIGAPASWWDGLSGVVGEILVLGGEDEVLIDSIKTISKALAEKHKSVKGVFVAGGHDEVVLDYMLGMGGRRDAYKAVQSFVGSVL